MTQQDHIPTEQQGYPRLVCERCALAAGGHEALAEALGGQWRIDTCEICGVKKEVARPALFGSPDFRTLSAEKLHGPQGHQG